MQEQESLRRSHANWKALTQLMGIVGVLGVLCMSFRPLAVPGLVVAFGSVVVGAVAAVRSRSLGMKLNGQ